VIVDVHTHTPSHRSRVPPDEIIVNERWRPDRPVVATNSWADYDEACSAADLTIAFNIAVDDPVGKTGIPSDPTRINESTAEFVAAAPDRRIGFMSVDPSSPECLDEVERCRFELGLLGIKLAPNYQRFDPLGEDARGLFALASKLELPIMIHQGASPIREAELRYAHPLVMDEVAIAFPDLRVVLAHMGHPWQKDTIVTIRKHPHLYADTSALVFRPWSLFEALRVATEWGVTDKLLFGSDFPLATPAETIDGLRAVNTITEGTRLPPVPHELIERIIHADALAALGLPGPPTSPAPDAQQQEHSHVQ
jgi:predicted TIM-barrel fold metal-dependent hydrolase